MRQLVCRLAAYRPRTRDHHQRFESAYPPVPVRDEDEAKTPRQRFPLLYNLFFCRTSASFASWCPRSCVDM
ncbi:hypothetical protein Trco_008085 [Trichoderma cornu-damae]|uniref:Uncharacterized protein n=1 Tax=Trichoderma cornu-damae TaxID=654480 RepID=A0A9P8QEX5_9HYPO|nr:hypothetical protein Trco_008085 [Trichoderma cornu-damae]